MSTAVLVTAKCGASSASSLNRIGRTTPTEGRAVRYRAERLILAHIGVAFATFAVAAVLGAWQMTVRSPIGAPFASPETYFASVTAHGTILAYVMPTLFTMGFGYFVAVTALDRPLPSLRLAWAGFWLAMIGIVMAVVPIVMGRATVLYTFYPPLTGSVFYYLGVVLVVAGSWGLVATVANAILWAWTTGGVAVELLFQVIPAALGWTQTIDVGLARTLFAWTLHPIVYFWLLPAYIAFYTMAPQADGGRLYSDTMGRLAFILFLLYSLPVGMHRSEEHTSELQSRQYLVCRLLLEK